MKPAANTRDTDRIALMFLVGSCAFLIFGYGFAAAEYKLFPYEVFTHAKNGLQELRTQSLRTGAKPVKLPWFYRKVDPDRVALEPGGQAERAYEGLNLVTRIGGKLALSAEILDMDNRPLHRWDVDWFKIWPDPDHVSEARRPKNQPGTHIHGAVVLEDGKLVMNFEHLGLVCLDRQGDVVWRLPYRTHHSIHRQDNGNLWVCGQIEHSEVTQRFPNRLPPFDEYTLLEVTPDGIIVQDWSVAEILRQNGLDGLLHLGSLHNFSTQVGRQDVLHLNDVEPFPDSMEEDFFRRGDVMVSLRNINTVFVFNQHSGEIRFICTGWFVRQHDPDFIDGNRFSVYDNNNIGAESNGQQSRIVIVSAREGTRDVFFEGSEDSPFYSSIMGKHQWLPNGNLLVTESYQGRAFELDPHGEIVWEYQNDLGNEVIGIVEEVQRISIDNGPFSVSNQSGEAPPSRVPSASDGLHAADLQRRMM